MLDQRHEEAIELGTRAERLARAIGDRETVIHAQTNVGTTLLQQGDDRGTDLLEEAFGLAMEDGHDDHAARALVNLATGWVTRRRGDARIPEHVERALRFVRERELRRLRPVPARRPGDAAALPRGLGRGGGRRGRLARLRRGHGREPVPGR